MKTERYKQTLCFKLLLLGVGICVFACKFATPNTPCLTDQYGVPKITLRSAWKIDAAYPGFLPMTLSGDDLYIAATRPHSLIRANAATGEVLWRTDLPIFPKANPVVHGDDIYVIGDGGPPAGIFIVWLKHDGTYMGKILVGTSLLENPIARRLHVIEDAIFWGDSGYSGDLEGSCDLWRFDLTQPLENIGDHEYRAKPDALKVIYRKNSDGLRNVIGGQVLSVGTDVVFTYQNYTSSIERVEPTLVLRLNATTGAVVWEYPTVKARAFWWNDLLLDGDKILVNGSAGLELIDADNPLVKTPYWAYDAPLYHNSDTGYIADGKLFEVSFDAEHAIKAFSMTDGRFLWSLSNTTSVGQGCHYRNGVLYVSEYEGIAAIDAEKGTIIGRDNTKMGYTDQCSNVLAYGNLFIYFSNSQNEAGIVEAVYMDVKP